MDKDLLSQNRSTVNTTNTEILKYIITQLLTYTRIFLWSQVIPVSVSVHSIFPNSIMPLAYDPLCVTPNIISTMDTSQRSVQPYSFASDHKGYLDLSSILKLVRAFADLPWGYRSVLWKREGN